MPSKSKYRKEQYPFVIPDLKDWPIVQLTRDKEAFIEKLVAFTKARISSMTGDQLSEEIERTMYLETKRMKEDPWRIDPTSDKKFWKKVRKDLLRRPLDKDEKTSQRSDEQILEDIIRLYATEIAGNFNIKTYWFARRFLTNAFTRLLNAASAKDFFKIWGMRHRLQERIQAVGEIEHVRALVEKGTVVLVPTHFSNLDSILIGLTMDFVGLPAFSYGAGLNLFNSGFVSYFMNRLGAYRIDRRKKSPIYIETLKGYSSLSIERGVNSLFFPGGTRSRSGQIEKRLKMGLLGTAVEAQRRNYESGSDKKIYIVPLVLDYHFVLEAKSLMEQYLKKTGKEQYYSKDEFRNPFKVFQFIWKFFRQSSEIVVSFGKPFDILGNFVDEEGKSFDKHNNLINTKDYFVDHTGQINQDLQREAEYTKIVSERIVERLYKENVVLTSHVLAFTAFKYLEHENEGLDIFNLLRISYKSVIFEKERFHQLLAQVQKTILEFGETGELKVSDNVSGDLDNLIKNGLSNLGILHDQKPLFYNKKKGYYRTQSLRLLL